MKFADKNDSIFSLLVLLAIFSGSSNDEVTIIQQISLQEVFIYSSIFFICTILIFILIKYLKKQTVLNLVLIFAFYFIVVSHYYAEVHHYFTAKDIEIEAKVKNVHEVILKEIYKDNGTYFDRVTIETSNEVLNNKDIYDETNKVYSFLKVGDKFKIKGRISNYIFKAEEFILEDKEKQIYYKKYMKN